MSAFGFNVDNVFGDGGFGTARKGRKTKRKKDSMDNMMEGSGLGIDTFSLKEPKIDALGFGGDFGEQIGSRAGKANGKGGGFLDIIGKQQRLPSARVTGRGRIARGKARGRGKTRGRTPLQRASGSSFGDVDRKFAGNVIGNVRGAKRRISEFRERRRNRKSKTESTRDTPQIAFKQPALRSEERPALAFSQPALRQEERPALEDKSRSSQ